ncbi:MAG: BON domain-containing protein [Planctomycetes bacterium]|nr:BON domain-containing protein [Planctomycetota bacterium]
MRRYQKWLSVGLLSLTPHFALADEINSPAGSSAPAAAAAQKQKSSPNQELADRVAKALSKARMNQYEIDIDARNGVVTLVGTIGKPEQRAAAEKVCLGVPGVTRVVNRLQLAQRPAKSDIEQAVATGTPRSAQAIRRTSGERPVYGGLAPTGDAGMQPITPQGITGPAGEPARIAFNGPPPQMAGGPQYCPPGAYPGAGGPMPAGPMPAGAYQMNGPGPNYAAGAYPAQQAASAYPAVGPYYPYPQIPLGWRKASLEWDDGYWNLNFRSRTDKWWWYMNPKNW